MQLIRRSDLFFEFRTRTTILFLSFLIIYKKALSANVLIIHPLYSGSHVLTLRSVAEGLTQRGHNVHTVRWKDMHSLPVLKNQNMTETVLSVNNENRTWNFLTPEKEAAFKMPYSILWNSGLSYMSVIQTGIEAFPLMEEHCNTLLSNEALIENLRTMSFEVAIIDIIYNECSLVLLDHLGIPAVGYWAFPFASGEADYTTASLPPSHVPAFMSRMTQVMGFKERFFNVLRRIGSHLVMQTQCYFVKRSAQSQLPGSRNPCDLISELSGMLINTDYAMDYPRLLPPTFVNVGGLQIRQPKSLPKEIEDWMHSSGEHGVILFTMGFIFNPQVAPKRLINAFMDAFARFPHKFLMKFEGHVDFTPDNVKVLSWIPQQDVLAHNKTKVFVTHCGLHGVMEAIYHGVPMLGMPIFIDQGDALVKMEERGIALGLDKETATADEIEQKLRKLLYEPSFKNNVSRISNLMRDAKETPMERALDLITYVMRHKGASHLKLASKDLNFVEYFCLDAILLMILIATTSCYLHFIFARKIMRKLFNNVDCTTQNDRFSNPCSVKESLQTCSSSNSLDANNNQLEDPKKNLYNMKREIRREMSNLVLDKAGELFSTRTMDRVDLQKRNRKRD